MKSKSRALAALAAPLCVVALALTGRAEDPPAAESPGLQDVLRARAFSARETHARRAKLWHACGGEGAVVIVHSGKSDESDALRHRANRDFLYLTGLEEPESWIVLDGQTETLFLPPRKKALDIWTGLHPIPGEATARELGFDAARSTENVKGEAIRQTAEGAKSVYFAGTTASELGKLGVTGGEERVHPCAAAIGRLRQVKDDAELALEQRACALSALAFAHCGRALAPGGYEYQVQALFEAVCRFHGAETQGYPSIVGSGPNSCVLHYDTNRRQLRAGDLIVLDAGAECGGYSADVTRTLPVSGRFTPEQRKIYDAVLAAQDAGIAACQVGATVREVDAAARAVLKREGILQYMPHGVSHWLGLDVHDAGDYALPLKAGMVLTVEPGCYIAEKELGVRIEDDILVTDDGPVILSGGAPRTAVEIEAMIARARAGAGNVPAFAEPTALPPIQKHKGKLY